MMKLKCFWVLVFFIFSNSICFAFSDQITRPEIRNDFKRIELGLMGGPGMSQFDFNNSFSGSYSYYWYDVSYYSWRYTEYDFAQNYSSSISGTTESNIGFGGFLNYLFTENIGIQFMLETSSFDVPLETSHNVDLSISYYWGDSSHYSDSVSVEDTAGSLSVMPISLNIYSKFYFGPGISGHLSGGATYYQVNIQADSRGGYGMPYFYYNSSYDLWFLWGDSVMIPVSIDDSYNGVGGNAGVGLSFQIHENLGILADFRYYLAPKEEFTWNPRAGSYTTLLNDKYNWNYKASSLDIAQDDIDTFMEKNGESLKVEVDPSYYRFSFGLQFRF